MSSFIFKSINIVGRGIFRGFVYLQCSVGHIGAQTPVTIPVYTYLEPLESLAKTLFLRNTFVICSAYFLLVNLLFTFVIFMSGNLEFLHQDLCIAQFVFSKQTI